MLAAHDRAIEHGKVVSTRQWQDSINVSCSNLLQQQPAGVTAEDNARRPGRSTLTQTDGPTDTPQHCPQGVGWTDETRSRPPVTSQLAMLPPRRLSVVVPLVLLLPQFIAVRLRVRECVRLWCASMPSPVEELDEADEFEQVWHQAATATSAPHRQLTLTSLTSQPSEDGGKQATVHEQKERQERETEAVEGTHKRGSIRLMRLSARIAAVDAAPAVSHAVIERSVAAVIRAPTAAVDEWGAVNDAHAAHIQQTATAGTEGAIRPATDANNRFTHIHATQANQSAKQPHPPPLTLTAHRALAWLAPVTCSAAQRIDTVLLHCSVCDRQLLGDGSVVASLSPRVQLFDYRCLSSVQRLKYRIIGPPKLRGATLQRQRLGPTD